MASKKIEHESLLDLESCIQKMESTLKSLGIKYKLKGDEVQKEFFFSMPYYLQDISISAKIYINNQKKTTISLSGKSDDLFGKGIIKNFDLIISKFDNLNTEGKIYSLDDTSFGKSLNSVVEKFFSLSLPIKIGVIFGLVALIGAILDSKTSVFKPSICDCNKVMSYEEGAVDAAKRILDYDAGENFISAAQRQCGLEYWDEIDKWQKGKSKSLGFEMLGTPADNAIEFFFEKCQ